MSDFILDENGELNFVNGDIQVNSGVEAIRQRLQIRLTIAWGEWRFDLEAYVAYYEKILGGKNLDIVDNELVRVTLGTPGIIGLFEPNQYAQDPVTRELSVIITAQAETGETVTATL